MVKRFTLATDYSILLFFPAMLVGTGHAFFTASQDQVLRAAVAGSIPAAAALLFSFLALAAPHLVSPQARGSFLTLPLVFTSLMVAITVLAISMGNPLTKLPEELRPALGWLDWKLLGASFLLQAGLFAIKSRAKADR
ncbi:MAG: hypothetical protein WAO58_05405 [Fimbriimonadaceae bacterium]